MPIINIQKLWQNKALWVLYILLGLKLALSLYFGQSYFITTAYVYSLIGLVSYLLLTKYKVATNMRLIVLVTIASLFAGEFSLRYILRYPLSYGEQYGNGYIMVYRYNEWNNIRFLYLKHRHDRYTLQFDPGEIRDNDCGDYRFQNDTCNALGFRGSLADSTKEIILVLGDSFTEGAGAPVDSSIPALLRRYVNAHDSDIDVLNAGVPGNDIFFDWQMVQKLKQRYWIKQLIFIMNTTDVNDVAVRGGSERFDSNGSLHYKKGAWWEPIYAVSYIVRLCMNNALRLDYNLMTVAEQQAAQQQAIREICSLTADQIAPWARAHHVPATIVLHPLMQDMSNTWDRAGYDTLLGSLRKVPGIEVLDCRPALAAKGTPQTLYWPHDRHFRPVGYSIIASTIITGGYLDLDTAGTETTAGRHMP